MAKVVRLLFHSVDGGYDILHDEPYSSLEDAKADAQLLAKEREDEVIVIEVLGAYAPVSQTVWHTPKQWENPEG